MYYKQGIPQIDLFIEKETDRTPEPGRYFLFKDGQVQGNARGYHHLKRAQQVYSDLLAASGYVPPISNLRRTPASAYGTESAQPKSSECDRRAALREESQYDFLTRAEVYWATSSAHRAKRRRR